MPINIRKYFSQEIFCYLRMRLRISPRCISTRKVKYSSDSIQPSYQDCCNQCQKHTGVLALSTEGLRLLFFVTRFIHLGWMVTEKGRGNITIRTSLPNNCDREGDVWLRHTSDLLSRLGGIMTVSTEPLVIGLDAGVNTSFYDIWIAAVCLLITGVPYIKTHLWIMRTNYFVTMGLSHSITVFHKVFQYTSSSSIPETGQRCITEIKRCGKVSHRQLPIMGGSRDHCQREVSLHAPL